MTVADVAIGEVRPVSSNDLEGLRLIRDRAPAGMAVTAGEYGYNPEYFRRMLDARAVDVLQADVTRACGATGREPGPDPARSGLGIELKRADAEPFRV